MLFLSIECIANLGYIKNVLIIWGKELVGLELQHRLIRQTINIAVNKAMEDMKSNTSRSIRNLIDLGLLFSTSENQKWFFNAAKKVIANPKNPYNALATRTIADVDNKTIKNVGLNLGYSSLTYGANKLRNRQAGTDCQLPWLLIFDISGSYPDNFSRFEKLVYEGRELGIYSYILCPHEADDIIALCRVAKRFDECLFIFSTSPVLITGQTAGVIGEINNAAVSIQAEAEDLKFENAANAFRLLKQNRCLYGFHVAYNEVNRRSLTTSEYIRCAIELGNIFGIYIADNGVSDTCKETVYTFACKERGEYGQPLVALEWCNDMRNISEKILFGGGCMPIHLTEKVYDEYKKAKDALTYSLMELIWRKQHCTSYQ